LRLGLAEKALINAEKLHSLVQADLRVTYLLALSQFGSRKWDEAKKSAEEVLAEHPTDREMNLILADMAYNQERNLLTARKYLDVCLKQNPNDPGALYYLGAIRKMEGDVSGAIESLSKSLAVNPKNGEAQSALGALYLQSGDIPHAINALEQAVALAPKEAQNHYQLALAYSRANATERAKAQLEIYQQLKAEESKAAKDYKGPATSELPSMSVPTRP
jgi:tetratricopeptide (TPR) repeat protein